MAFALAILLHLLLLLSSNAFVHLLAFARPDPAEARPESPPLAFEFVDLPDSETEEPPPDETPFLSDRNATARDEIAESTEAPAPAVDGASDYSREVEPSRRRQEEAQDNTDEPDRTDDPESPSDAALDFGSLLAAEEAREASGREAIYGTPALPPPSVRMRNLAESARELGSFQLSTYDWDFAPYMKYLKRLVESNISPPPAFTHYGLIEGRTWVTFRIMRDGRLEALEVVRHEGTEGSKILAETSLRAVRNSARFKPLPEHFPDEYLQISGLFEYLLHRPPGRR